MMHESVVLASPGLEDDTSPELSQQERTLVQCQFEKMSDKEGMVHEVKSLLQNLGIKLDYPCDKTPLDLESFMNVFARIYAPASRYGSRFRMAAGRGDVNKMKELIARGCDSKKCDGLGLNALHMAASAGKIDAIEFLVRLDHKLLKLKDNEGFTPLILSAAAGHTAAFEKLLTLGSDIQATTKHGRNALHWACAKGRLDVFLSLIKRGEVDLKVQDNAGMTPLHLAAQHNHLPIVSKLVARNHQLLSLKNTLGMTPREYQDTVFWTRAIPIPPSQSASKKKKSTSR